MAEKRMFSKKITDNDNFISLSASAQALYLHLSMSADDDGFCDQVAISMFKAHASTQDLEALISKKYIYQFDSGVIVIKHWKMSNAIQSDRKKATSHKNELAQLSLDENKAYTRACIQIGNKLETNCIQIGNKLETNCIQIGNKLETNCIQIGNKLETQISIDKIRLDKIRLDVEEDNIHSVNNHTESLPHPQPEALPELDERDKVIQAWNAQTVTQNIEAINPLSKREQDTRLCINSNLDKYLQTINDLDNQSFFLDQSKRGNLLKYDWFCNPNNYQKVVEGNYKDGYSREPPRKEAVRTWERKDKLTAQTPVQRQKPVTSFNNFQQRSYDFGELERKLFNK